MNIAIIFAGGTGVRMNSVAKPKQFLELHGKAIIIYTLEVFEQHPEIDAIAVVCLEGWEDYLSKLMEKAQLQKVKWLVKGGKSGQESIFNGLSAVYKDLSVPHDSIVLIHDGARPLLSQGLINRCCDFVPGYKACVAAVPVTDTIKTGDQNGYAVETLDRGRLWSIQTPQAFSYPLIMDAYNKLFVTINEYASDESKITDDAVIVESMSSYRVKLILGDNYNIKITNPEDMTVAKALYKDFLQNH